MTQKILAIGNAIIDITCKVDDDFLMQNNLVKGSMSLIDEEQAEELSKLSFEKITSGGSAGNTIATLAQLGHKSSFIGKVANDEFGKKFISEISNSGVEFVNKNFSTQSSAKSFILITPDAQRTMCTYLGCASDISEDDIKAKDFIDVGILYLEGYLWDGDKTSAALKKAIRLAKENNVKTAFTLSDSFCVARHKEDFLPLVENDLDLLFANEAEILELTNQDKFCFKTLAEFFAKNPNLTAVVTRSEKGCSVFENNKFFESNAKEINHLCDTTGAGDAFAAGFLRGFSQNVELKKPAELGNILASKIIQKIGARFSQEEIQSIRL